jgi:hypothetical protein
LSLHTQNSEEMLVEDMAFTGLKRLRAKILDRRMLPIVMCMFKVGKL